jgi:type I restriction enzyme S subunit
LLSDLKITKAGLESGSRLADRDSVLLLVRGSELHKRIPIGIAGRAVAFNQDVKALKPKEGLLPSYLLYWLLGNEKTLLSKVEHTGIGAGKLDTDLMKELPFLLPSVAEQRAIAHLLGTLDDQIELNRRMNETLEEMARAIFKSWFVDFDPVRAKGEGRDPGLSEHIADLFPDRFEDSELGEMPVGWRVGVVEDLMILQRGFDLPKLERAIGHYPILAASGLSGTHDEYKVNGPGVTTGRSGVLGKVFFVHENYWPLNTSLWVKKFKASQPLHAYHFLGTLDLGSLNAGSAVPTLNRNHVHNLPALVPDIRVVEAHEKYVMPMFSQHRANLRQSETLAAIRDALLPKLVSGEIRVREAEAFVEETA